MSCAMEDFLTGDYLMSIFNSQRPCMQHEEFSSINEKVASLIKLAIQTQILVQVYAPTYSREDREVEKPYTSCMVIGAPLRGRQSRQSLKARAKRNARFNARWHIIVLTGTRLILQE